MAAPQSPLRVHMSDEDDVRLLDQEADMYEERDTTNGDFTFRAVFVGLLVGVILCMTNIYFGLQTGWISMMSLQSALIGFAVFKVIPLCPIFSKSNPLTPQENVVLQTTAVATGTMPLAAGLVGIIPALEQLSERLDGQGPIVLSWLSLVGWCLAVAFFGVFLAAPLRRQVIVKEKLVFPSGTATAQLIALLHRTEPVSTGISSSVSSRHRGYEAVPRSSRSTSQARSSRDSDEYQVADNGELREQVMGNSSWAALAWSFVASGAMTLMGFFFPVIFALPVFDIIGAPFGTSLAADWMWWFTPSLSYVGQGIIMGFPVTVAMNAGMLTGWAILSPLAKHAGWAPAPVSDSVDGSRGWILWVALAIMIAESIISLMPITISYAKTALLHHRQRSSGSKLFQAPASPRNSMADDDYFDPTAMDENPEEMETEPPERLVPLSWVWTGLSASGILGVSLVWLVFGHEGIKPWATALGLLIASILSLLGVRALGETDLNPVSGIGKISQLLFAVLQPGNVVANIIAGGVAEAGAQQAGDLMQDLKTGALLKASPRSQFYGQMIGSLASVFVSTAAYKMYTTVYTIPGPEFRVPTAAIWLNLARLLNNGHLPPKSVHFMVGFGVIFSINSFLRAFKTQLSLPPRVMAIVKYLPSGIAFAIGFLNSPSFSLARLIGGYVAYRTSRGGETPLLMIVVASGFVLGEGVFSIVTLAMTSGGFKSFSCFGCSLGGGGYCGGGC